MKSFQSFPHYLFLVVAFLSGCNSQEIQNLSEEISKSNQQLALISEELENSKNESKLTRSILSDFVLNFKELNEENDNKSKQNTIFLKEFTEFISPQVKSILAGQQKEERRRVQSEKNKHPTKIGIVDLDNIARKIADQRTEVKRASVTPTKEEAQKVALLVRKQTELRTLEGDRLRMHIPGREIPPRVLSEEENHRVSILKEDISKLQDEVGHLIVKPVSLFDVKDEAQRLVIELVKGKYLIVFDRGFHSGKNRVLFQDDSVKTEDLTPIIIQNLIHPGKVSAPAVSF